MHLNKMYGMVFIFFLGHVSCVHDKNSRRYVSFCLNAIFFPSFPTFPPSFLSFFPFLIFFNMLSSLWTLNLFCKGSETQNIFSALSTKLPQILFTTIATGEGI